MTGRSPLRGSGSRPTGGAAKASPAKPSIPNAALLSDLREPPVVGRTYMVPCAEYVFLNRRDVWPVIGPRHEDSEYIGFSSVHYHVDPRFLTGEQARYVKRHGHGNSVKTTAAIYVLARVGDPTVALAALQPRRCRIRTWAYSPPSTPKWLTKFNQAFGKIAEPIRTSDGRLLCPHKKADLSQFVPDENGIVTCPLHGLRVRCSALAGEAGTAATVKQDAVHEHATAQPERPTVPAILPNKERTK